VDEFIKEIHSQLNRLKVGIESIQKDSQMGNYPSFGKSIIVRPALEKDPETARKKAFLKKNKDESGYEPGPGYKEREEYFLLNEKINRCLKID
jgi:hypothetical protein